LTVAKTFALAIEEAAKLHPAAKPLIVYASLLAPEPIPLYFFAEAREKFAGPFASLLKDDGLEEAVGALLAFALVDRESIPDERDASIKTDCIRLHRLVRQVAASLESAAHARMCGELIEAMATTYPADAYNNPAAWPKARRLDVMALALVDGTSLENATYAIIFDNLAAYRLGFLVAYADARCYCERALAIRENTLGPDHRDTATSLNNLGLLLQSQGNLAGARPYLERALAIAEKILGPEHPDTARSLNNLGLLLVSQGDFASARPCYERALAICEKAIGSDHPNTATSLNNLGLLLEAQGDLAGARPCYEHALAINETALGPDHPDTARSLNNLGLLLASQGDLAGARPYLERGLAICEKALGPDHPDTGKSFRNLGLLLTSQGDLAGGRSYHERALDICEKRLGLTHPDTRIVARNSAALLDQLNLPDLAASIRKKFSLEDDS
jgi:tetratricopeptide (TPR) repeat protein